MNTESQQQIAREAALEIWGPNDSAAEREITESIILSAIERATDGCINTGYKAGVSDVKAIAKSDNSEYYRKCYIKCANDFDDLRQELTAERQRREQSERETKEIAETYKVEMERYLRESGCTDDQTLVTRILQLRATEAQLLSALAAIEKFKTQITIVCALSGDVAHQCDFHAINASKWWKAVQKLQKMIVVDLPLLHERDEKVRDSVRDHYATTEWHKGWAAAVESGESNKERLIAEVRKPLVDALEHLKMCPVLPDEDLRLIHDALAKVKQAAICCPICAHITSYPADAEVVKCEHCLRSFQLEPTKKETPDGDNNKRTETH